MTFDQIVAETMDRLNLTTPTATTRVGKEVNDRYRRLTSSIGLETSRRVQVHQTATIGNRTMTFPSIEKVIAVVDKSSGTDMVLTQLTFDEMHDNPVKSQPPRNYAITNMHANSVDIYLDCVPTTAFTLYVDGHTSLSTLTGVQAPDFPESFHDILVFGAMADEYRKMEKVQLMADSEANYEKRLSDLRMWIAKSGYNDIVQGKIPAKTLWWKV